MSRRRGLAPGAVTILVAGGVCLAFTSEHPAVMLALAAGAAALVMAARREVAPILITVSVVSALGWMLLTPFVAAQGDLILLEGPAIPVIDTQVTLEEVAYGAIVGLRVLSVALLIGVGLAVVDQDRLLGGAMRLAPRSALTAALAARALPALERDARALADTARARGAHLGDGGWTRRARASSHLVVPLLGSSLERSLDVAEAMSARGYGAARRTRRPGPRPTAGEAALAAAGCVLAALALASALGIAPFDPYPRLVLEPDPVGLAVAAAAAAALGWAALVVRAR
jgi:energy-coupling factor transport system permease protein